MVYSSVLVALVFQVPLAFGTGEGDADRWSAQAGMDTARCIDGDRMWGIHQVIGSRNLRVGEAPV
jgi:hypothetical protein